MIISSVQKPPERDKAEKNCDDQQVGHTFRIVEKILHGVEIMFHGSWPPSWIGFQVSAEPLAAEAASLIDIDRTPQF